MIEAQKLKTYQPSKFQPGFASEKFNGIHAIYDGRKFYTRNKKEIQGLSVLKAEMDEVRKGTFKFIGELVIPDITFEEMNGLIRSFKETPNAEFYIFNLHKKFTSWTFNFKLDKINELRNLQPHVKPVKFTYVKGRPEFDKFYEDTIEKGAEGVCLIKPDAIYTPGTRNWDWVKRVPFKSIEACIIGVLAGAKGKKFENTLGRFQCKLMNETGTKFAVGIFKGFNTEWRNQMWEKRDTLINKVCTIEFKAYSSKGTPVQPRFIGFRWDT